MDQQPLSEIGEVPVDPPDLTITSTQIPVFTLDWSSGANHQVVVGDGTMPQSEVEVTGSQLSFSLSAPETPLMLRAMFFEGDVESVDPTSDPVKEVDCLAANGDCVLTRSEDELGIVMPLSGLPADSVASVYVEYYKDSEWGTESGPTNTAGWVFGIKLH